MPELSRRALLVRAAITGTTRGPRAPSQVDAPPGGQPPTPIPAGDAGCHCAGWKRAAAGTRRRHLGSAAASGTLSRGSCRAARWTRVSPLWTPWCAG